MSLLFFLAGLLCGITATLCALRFRRKTPQTARIFHFRRAKQLPKRRRTVTDRYRDFLLQ